MSELAKALRHAAIALRSVVSVLEEFHDDETGANIWGIPRQRVGVAADALLDASDALMTKKELH